MPLTVQCYVLAIVRLLQLCYKDRMSVQNRIIKVQKRNRALVTFDPGRICLAILRAAESIGGFEQDLLPDINGRIFDTCGSDYKIASFMADAVIICLNA